MICMTNVYIAGNWKVLLKELPGWTEIEPNVWKGAGAMLHCNVDELSERFCFILPEEEKTNLLMLDRKCRVQIDKSIEKRRDLSEYENNNVPRLCHIAVNLGDSTVSLVSRVMGNLPMVLNREKRFDPILNRNIETAHYYLESGIYLTEKYEKDGFGLSVDHIGFECTRSDQVNSIFSIMQKIEWPVLFGPEWIDGSYVLHFGGPDGRVHDFYYVGPMLNSEVNDQKFSKSMHRLDISCSN